MRVYPSLCLCKSVHVYSCKCVFARTISLDSIINMILFMFTIFFFMCIIIRQKDVVKEGNRSRSNSGGHTNVLTTRQMNKQTNKQTPKQTNKETPKQTNKETPKQTNKETPKQTNKYTPKKIIEALRDSDTDPDWM